MPETAPRHARREPAATPAPTAATKAPKAPAKAPAVEAPTEALECNVPGCPAEPEHRGLCPAHRQTHRGLLGPKEDPRV